MSPSISAPPTRRRWIWMIALGAALAGLYVWNPFGPSTGWWMEDVALDDGSTIEIKRTVAYTEADAMGGGAYSMTVLASTLSFTSALASLPTWSMSQLPLMPTVLYRDATRNGQWVIVATTTTCEVWNRRGEPAPPYWEFRLGDLEWQEVPLSSTSFNRPTNLYLSYSRLNELYDSHHVSPGEVSTALKDSAERYRFVRAQARSNCPSSPSD